MQVEILQELPLGIFHRKKLAVGTVHRTIPAPKGEARNTRESEVWVYGADDEPVKLLHHEYKKAA